MFTNVYKHLWGLALALLCAPLWAQNTPRLNEQSASGSLLPMPSVGMMDFREPLYYRTYTPLLPFTDPAQLQLYNARGNAKAVTVYKDAFGKELMRLGHYANGDGLLPHIAKVRDARLRKYDRDYLPYATDVDGFDMQAFDRQASFYQQRFPYEGATAFSEGGSVSDASKRATKAYLPGKSQVGQGRGIVTTQLANTAFEVKIWRAPSSGPPYTDGYYAAGALNVERITDDEGGESWGYTDRSGRRVLKKTYLHDNGSNKVYALTYYVYDDMGRLRAIIPPKAEALSATSVPFQAWETLCFQYDYDDPKGRLSAVRYPGHATASEVVYDPLGRTVMKRTPLLRAEGKWEVVLCDAQGRPKATLLYSNAEDRSVWQARLDGGPGGPSTLMAYLLAPSGHYPGLTEISGGEVLAYHYYDDHVLDDPSGSLLSLAQSALAFTETLGHVGAETPEALRSAQGQATGLRLRLLPAPGADPAQVGDWRERLIWYDKKGRPVLTLERDLYQGQVLRAHFTGMQYDFLGRVLVTKHVVRNLLSADGATEHVELSRSEYDPVSGLALRNWRKVDGGAWTLQKTVRYDELGRPRQAVLGAHAETQDFSYTIDGQLAGINKAYAETGDQQGLSRSFGVSLKYDYGFATPRYDHKPTGIVWRGSGPRSLAYGYRYDKSGRLLGADFSTDDPVPGQPTWNRHALDYTVSNVSYDLNGNMLTMDQKGVLPGTGIVDMDRLTYSYGGDNRLERVDDAAGGLGLGDFAPGGGSGAAYAYDDAGNLTADANKGITGVDYFYFGKPSRVRIGGKELLYSYDASGALVQELSVVPGQPSRKRDYVGGFVYLADSLAHALTAEGRTVFEAGGPHEEYFVKDHLGNVRSIVDVRQYPLLEYLATYEVASANLEGLLFDHHGALRDARPGPALLGDEMSGRLNGDDPDRRVGTALLVKVMAGDRFELTANSFYDGYRSSWDAPLSSTEALSALLGTLTGGLGGIPGEAHNTDLVGQLFKAPNYSLVDQLKQVATDPSRPRAYLHYMFFDEAMQLVPWASGAFQASGDGDWAQIGTDAPKEIPTNGYLAVYLSNETRIASCSSCGDVYFDQVLLSLGRGNLKEEVHYYPHGLPMSGMGASAPGLAENRHRYQGNEYRQEHGLNWMDFRARQYDPQLGRFLSVDPLAGDRGQESFSPYAAMGNMPSLAVDPLGLEPQQLQEIKRRTEVTRGYVPQSYAQKFASKGNNSSGGDKKTTAKEQASAAKLDDKGTATSQESVKANSAFANSADDKGETADNSIEKKGDPDQKVESMPDAEGTGGYGFLVTAKMPDPPPPPVDIRRLVFDHNEEVDWYTRMSMANWMVGVVGVSLEASSSTYRLFSKGYGFSPWIYSKNYPASTNFKRYSLSRTGKGLGTIAFGLGAITDVVGMGIYMRNPGSINAVHPGQGLFNIGMGAYGNWVNPVGGMLYYGVDVLYPGGWMGDGTNSGALMDQSRMIEGIRQVVPTFNMYRDIPGGW